MPIPMGIIPASSRAHVLNLYYEVSAVGSTIYFWRNKNSLRNTWVSKTAPSSTWKGRTSPETNWSGKVTPQDGSTQEI